MTAVYPALLSRKAAGWERQALANVLATSAEGYAFPTSLDRDQPIGGMAPPSQATLVADALAAGTSPQQLVERLAAHAVTKLNH
ncbi:hypothetical protein [Micromonospora inositola]|uniref:hypothetical protein n=1 Tax=Micromonospora inositola TaxID=47865 RepID=UPI000B5AE6E6|nr:hypothetical protein [Micromonospora inositola]